MRVLTDKETLINMKRLQLYMILFSLHSIVVIVALFIGIVRYLRVFADFLGTRV